MKVINGQRSFQVNPYEENPLEIEISTTESFDFIVLKNQEKILSRQVLSFGVVQILSELTWKEGEKEYFGKEVYGSLVNGVPLNEQVAWSINKAHKEGHSSAAEALTILADFYQFKVSDHDLNTWGKVLAFFDS